MLIIEPIITHCTYISTDLPFNVSTPFNTYQQSFIARMPYAGYCITFNTVSFDRVIQCWILSLTIYIMNSCLYITFSAWIYLNSMHPWCRDFFFEWYGWVKVTFTYFFINLIAVFLIFVVSMQGSLYKTTDVHWCMHVISQNDWKSRLVQ